MIKAIYQPVQLASQFVAFRWIKGEGVKVYNQSAPGNQHFCELLPRANDVINIYIYHQIKPEMQDLAVNEVHSLPVP